MLRSAERSFGRAFAPGLAAVDGPHRNLRAGRRTAWLTDAELALLNRYLERIHALFARRHPRTTRARLHEFTYVLAPIVQKGRRRGAPGRKEFVHDTGVPHVRSADRSHRNAAGERRRAAAGAGDDDPIRSGEPAHRRSGHSEQLAAAVVRAGYRCQRAIVRLDTARELGLTLHGEVRTGGAGSGTAAGQLVKGATWSLVGLDRFSQPLAFALPMPLLSAGLGRKIDGIIGGEFIKQFVLELDYHARSIRLHDRQTFRYGGPGETLPIEFNSDGHPIVAATLTPLGGKPVQHRFLLDVGSGLALGIHSPFVAEHNLLGGDVRTIRAIGMEGAGGVSVGRLGRVAALQIGSFKIDNPIALFSRDKAGAFANASLAGNIGAQIASRFRIILDYGTEAHDPRTVGGFRRTIRPRNERIGLASRRAGLPHLSGQGSPRGLTGDRSGHRCGRRDPLDRRNGRDEPDVDSHQRVAGEGGGS